MLTVIRTVDNTHGIRKATSGKSGVLGVKLGGSTQSSIFSLPWAVGWRWGCHETTPFLSVSTHVYCFSNAELHQFNVFFYIIYPFLWWASSLPSSFSITVHCPILDGSLLSSIRDTWLNQVSLLLLMLSTIVSFCCKVSVMSIFFILSLLVTWSIFLSHVISAVRMRETRTPIQHSSRYPFLSIARVRKKTARRLWRFSAIYAMKENSNI